MTLFVFFPDSRKGNKHEKVVVLVLDHYIAKAAAAIEIWCAPFDL